jgi:hypothetical protein
MEMTEREWDLVILPRKTCIDLIGQSTDVDTLADLFRRSMKNAYQAGRLDVQVKMIDVLSLRHLLGGR